MPKSVPIQSIKRALDILDLVTTRALHGEGVSLQEAAAHIEVGATTAHNILRTMATCGYLERSESRAYHPGPRCRDISRQSRLSNGMLAAAARVVSGLVERTGESVVLAALSHGQRHPLLRADGHAAVRVSSTLESPGSPFRWVTGRILAAHATPAELRAILDAHGLPGEAWDAIATEEQLAAALARMREAGIAEDRPSGGDVYALAVPVLDHQDALLAALGLFIPAFRATEERLAGLRAEIRAAAAEIAGAG